MPNNKDWLKQTIAHNQTSAVPYSFMFSPPAEKALLAHYGPCDLNEQLKLPIRANGPISIKPLYAFPADHGDKITDEFGVTWTTSDIDRGSPVGPPLISADLSGYKFPDPNDAYRFEGLDEWCRDNKEHFTVMWVGDLWERATFVRGMENILLDLALNKPFIEKLLAGITEYILKTMQILFDKCDFDCIALSDDYGTQHGMLMSPADWRQMIKPHLTKIYALAKKNNRYVFHHSCGNIIPIIGEMIDIGLDVLHPIQPEAMDVFALKDEFGDDLSFCGGLDTQNLLPKGTPQQIRDQIKKLKDYMAKDGGYILEPGITVQGDVPLENMLAMIAEAQK